MPTGSDQNDNSVSFGEVTWRDGDVPASVQFDDAYFAYQDGLAETNEVFIAGNDLNRRWADGERPRVAELGFGTGLNFLATLAWWRAQVAMTDQQERLRFVSFEQYPLAADEMRRAIAPWPELASGLDDLLTHWPPAAGANQLALPDADLTLIIGDACDLIHVMREPADAWYLDGFSPAKNPELWSPDLLAAVFERTGPGGTFSTYTAAGWVRRALTGAGFEVTKVPGFATKRERLQGFRP